MQISMKTCFFVLLILVLFAISSHGFTMDEIANLQKKHFKDDDSLGVKEIDKKNQCFYLIRGSLFNLFNDPASNMQRKLSILNKGRLLKYIQKSHKNGKRLKGIELQNWFNAIYYETKKRSYLLSYINKENVSLNFSSNNSANSSNAKKSQDPEPNKEVIVPGDFENSAQKEIDSIKEYLKNHPDSIEGHQDLYQYYKIQNDIDNMSTTMDTIMDLQFMHSN